MPTPLDVIIAPLLWLKRLILPPEFTIKIRGGEVVSARGRVPKGLRSDCQDIAKQCGVENGTVCGISSGQGIRLEFSPGVPASSHQRFRNACTMRRR